MFKNQREKLHSHFGLRCPHTISFQRNSVCIWTYLCTYTFYYTEIKILYEYFLAMDLSFTSSDCSRSYGILTSDFLILDMSKSLIRLQLLIESQNFTPKIYLVLKEGLGGAGCLFFIFYQQGFIGTIEIVLCISITSQGKPNST